jgi:hypothetical protein
MILHTIVSMEDIMGPPPVQNTITKRVKGGIVELSGTDGNYTVNRLFSTDPSMYLKKEYHPASPFKNS